MPPKEGLDIAVHTGKDSVEYVKYHGVSAVIEYVKLQHRICGSNKKPRPIYHHVDAPAIEGVEVEAHFRTGYTIRRYETGGCRGGLPSIMKDVLQTGLLMVSPCPRRLSM